MLNSTGFSTLIPLTLQRDCFSSEQDRLIEYAKSLRIPIQTGEIIKGDVGDPGNEGARGATGPPGTDGADGVTPGLSTRIVDIEVGVDFVVVSGDIRDNIINLYYDDEVNEPPGLVSIVLLRFDGTNTKIYLDVVTPDDLFKISVSTF